MRHKRFLKPELILTLLFLLTFFQLALLPRGPARAICFTSFPPGSYDTPDDTLGVFVSGGIAYVADDFSGLQIIDVSNPGSPVHLGSYDTPGFALGVFVSGGIAYVADVLGGLQIIDVSNPVSPVHLGSYDTPDRAFGVFVSGGIAYVADAFSGLQIIDVSNPILFGTMFEG